MFTDVVGFSRRAGEDEDRTLRMTARDLKIIGEFVARHEGRVIKSTGDGCLAFFASGVQAVACAQGIQHHFAELAQTLPSRDLLQHRIGIHLGDVYLKGNDVMGDGVNIAARLESEAPPGGICISQALYEIAKSRLSLKTVHLGAKQLKNIKESVQVYQVLIDAEDETQASPLRRFVKAIPPRTPGQWVGRVVPLLLVILAAIVLSSTRERDPAGTPDDTTTSGEIETPAGEDDLDTHAEDTTPAVPLDEHARAGLAEYPTHRKIHLATRDYKTLADWIEQHKLHGRGAPLYDDFVKYRKFADLFAWAESGLAGHHKMNPLAVNSPVAGRLLVWSDPNGQLTLKTPTGAERPTSLRRSPEAGYVLLVMSTLARESWGDQGASRGTAEGRLLDAMYVFAEEHKLDADKLLSTLKAPRGTGDRPPVGGGEDALFRRYDTNRDGKLARDELPELLRRRMMRADADADGKLTREELRDMRRRMPPRPRRP